MLKRTQEEIKRNWSKNYTQPMVSIRCITYNQEQYIAQALDSFLKQETSFPFEIDIHDDASTDKTADIIREYETKYPEIIKPVYESENMYSKHNGAIDRIMRDSCRGKYVAFCEGNDYWIDSNKLQRQVDFLEQNPDYSLSSENGLVLYTENDCVEPFSEEQERDYNLEDLLVKRRFPTASVVALNKYILELPFHKRLWNTAIWGLLAQKGKVHYNPIISSVYRCGSEDAKSNKIVWAQTNENINRRINELFSPSKKVRKARYRTLFYDYKNAFSYAVVQNQFYNAVKFFLKMITISPVTFIKELARKLLKERIMSLRTNFWRCFYSFVPARKLKPNSNCVPEIVVSITSYPARFKTLHLVLKSLLNQDFTPSKIILYLDKNVEIASLPSNILKLRSCGLQIKNICEDIKPHKKYFYAMNEFKNAIIVTADDDVIYPRDWLKSLYQSYLEFPNAVSARRVHKISRNLEGKAMPYQTWEKGYQLELNPSMELMATGVGGILYPPGIFNQMKDVFNESLIKDVCLGADDVWLKFIEKKNGIKVRLVPSRLAHPYIIEDETLEKTGLMNKNVAQNQNDAYILKCERFFNIKL